MSVSEEDFKTAINALTSQLERLIDVNMMVLNALDPEACATVDRVHNKLGMYMSDDWESEVGNTE